MKIVCISDTHLYHEDTGARQPVIPQGDLLIHSGDGTFRGNVQEIERFLDWLGKLPHPHKILVAGNHDWLFQTVPERARAMIPPGVTYLENQETTIEGLRIYGTPWTPTFMKWAFMAERGHRLKDKYRGIPEGIDILVSHGPPKGILDQVPDGEHVGSYELFEVVRRIKPRLHCFGHIHHGHGRLELDGTLYVNAAIVDEAYDASNDPIVVELSRSP